jgi:hypothetical protein
MALVKSTGNMSSKYGKNFNLSSSKEGAHRNGDPVNARELGYFIRLDKVKVRADKNRTTGTNITQILLTTLYTLTVLIFLSVN